MDLSSQLLPPAVTITRDGRCLTLSVSGFSLVSITLRTHSVAAEVGQIFPADLAPGVPKIPEKSGNNTTQQHLSKALSISIRLSL